MKMKVIASIGIEIPNVPEIKLDSFSSLSENDIVVFSPKFENTNYRAEHGNKHEGKKLYNRDSSASIIEHTKHWNRELLSFLKSGKTLIIVLSQKNEFFIYSGTKDVSGTGSNQKIINYVKPFSNYTLLPFKLDYLQANGKDIECLNNSFSAFFNTFKNYFSYEVYINDKDIKDAFFSTKNKDKVLGLKLEHENGLILFIPNLNFIRNDLIKYNNITNLGEWNEEAIQLGKRFVQQIVEVEKTVRNIKEKTQNPEWLIHTQYDLSTSIETRKIINDLETKIENLKIEVKNNIEKLDEQDRLKDLLFETGKPLELAVIKGLQILGYIAENYNDGILELDQIIISPEGHRYIGECEGKDNKDIDISKLRQLQDAINEDYARKEISEKALGLLFGNPQRFCEPEKRGIGFTDKCLKGAERESIGLIRTCDLFLVCKYLLESNDENFKKQCRIAIHEQLGKIIKFPKIEFA